MTTEEELTEALIESLTTVAREMTLIELVALILRANPGWEAMGDEVMHNAHRSQANRSDWAPTLADGLASFNDHRLAMLEEIVGVPMRLI